MLYLVQTFDDCSLKNEQGQLLISGKDDNRLTTR